MVVTASRKEAVRYYHVMIVAQKFWAGFDQPKLCAMYVDKSLVSVQASAFARMRAATRVESKQASKD